MTFMVFLLKTILRA